MSGILLAKFKMFIRNPWTFAIFTGMSIGFALMVGGTGGTSSIHVPVYAEDDAVRDSFIGEELKSNDAYSFNWMSEEEMKKLISNGKAEAGAILGVDDFQIIVGIDSPNTAMIEASIRGAYVEKLRQEEILKAANATSENDKEMILDEWQDAMESPVFKMKTSNFSGEDAVVHDNTFHSLFGFTLFFVIYTIAYNLLPVLIEKRDGIWDRMILSPVKKWEVYLANFIYSFFEGSLQVLVIFLIFRYWVGVDFNDRFLEALLLLIPYIFAIVSLSIFLTALVKTVQQFNAVIPIVAVSMAMIGGAYWPIEIVESKLLLALSKINPVTYGMEILNGTAIYGYSLDELLYPISILLFMGVLLTGIGIHLMERRHV